MTISDQAKEAITRVLEEGDTAIDATMGNGWDTVFLAETVGPSGKVLAFDVQEAALKKTDKRLERAGVRERCQLVHQGHETMGEHVSGGVGAVMFNLGYLPYADRSVITTEGTTLRALQTAREILRPGGVITIICYRGHPGGQDEARAVWQWVLAQSDSLQVDAPKVFPEGDGPFLLALTK
ncbi:class I SAM-dependent methyltransferase [Roseibacillus persicicus]|uniref:tRNA (mnm(5)s(2)U34)-methyltransferase n=1 Tax=Roseibacillus persicicus TaxID=454148 RepID=UPI00398AD708